MSSTFVVLKPMQRQICEQYKKTRDVVYEALALAVDECRTKLKDYPWNCSGIKASQILQHKGMMQTGKLQFVYDFPLFIYSVVRLFFCYFPCVFASVKFA